MRYKSLALLVLLPFIAACSKTNELYAEHAYNSSDFMDNYYSETSGVRELSINTEKTHDLVAGKDFYSDSSLAHIHDEDKDENQPWDAYYPDEYETEYGRHNNLSKINEAFAYGYISKLYDGRVRCESLYQKSRVQIDKHGYATFFPKQLTSYKYFAFSLRGGTDFENPLRKDVYINVHVNFFKPIINSNKYDLVTFNFNNVVIPCDKGGNTNLVSLYLTETILGETIYKYSSLEGTTAMSFSFELVTEIDTLSDDKDAETDHHFAVMLYEVLLPKSTWR